MKTSIDLPDSLFHEAVARAALAGQSFPELVAESLCRLLRQDPSPFVPEVEPTEEDAWQAMRRDFKNPFSGLTSMQILDELRGSVELPLGASS